MKSLLSLVAVAASVPSNALALSSSKIRSRSHQRQSASPSHLEPLSSPPRILESTVEETLDQTLTDENNLSPFLQGMVDEQRELQMNVGKAMDVLRKDYPYFLKRAPDYSIYHDAITLSASDGQIQLTKLSSYKKAFGVLRTMLPLLYDADRSVIQSRMVYDSTKTQIRVSFNAMLVPKIGGKTVHVDGISVYSIDLSATRDRDGNKRDGAGKIREHRIEKLLVNGAALQPPYFNAFGLEMVSGRGTGALVGAGAWS
eukprot:CAMPEP_0172535402 /NCGR_PEP_ID=MMETSP1067-20121228/7429_1 /TAXON_ID=265564 ORGANISM="Thalassiosira punctigera, Strain Tpunct2005C2" /NCGR_SAMPLE_ID=MMETSP1067 /ASSEMBLY_ACC=CAM_ASM_000444 /LENGTH=256 /DNA_ID=CAMNT_0013320335 /DNA_START=157 /DNA_END=927 /DNA_ORIENTATION=+